mgnify:CR=1 FL=1
MNKEMSLDVALDIIGANIVDLKGLPCKMQPDY